MCYIAPWRQLESRSQLSSDRSRSLLGVGCWDRYQNDRRELYFQLVCFVLSFGTFLFLVFSITRLSLSPKPNFHHLTISNREGDSEGGLLKNSINTFMMTIHHGSAKVVYWESLLWKCEVNRSSISDPGWITTSPSKSSRHFLSYRGIQFVRPYDIHIAGTREDCRYKLTY